MVAVPRLVDVEVVISSCIPGTLERWSTGLDELMTR